MSPSALVAHLVWAPLGHAPLDRFLASYRAHDAGAPHRLLVVYKEFGDEAALAAARRRVAEAAPEHEERVMPGSRLDLSAYAEIARDADAEWVFFLNSNSELLAPGWLAKPLGHLTRPGIGLVGATGSYEGSPARIVDRVFRRRALRPFPNPHIRTNAFGLGSALARELDWGRPRSKQLAWEVENGPHSLTRQVQTRGLEALVVGRDGVAYPPDRWPEAGTFRTPGHPNLLVADNRTREYDTAAPERRRELHRLAWGGQADLRSTVV